MGIVLRGLAAAVVTWGLVASPRAVAQTPPAAKSAAGGVEIYNTKRPYINYSEGGQMTTTEEMLNPYNPGAPYNPAYQENYAPKPLYNPNAPYIPGQEPQNEEPVSISRLSGGIALAMTNVGLIHSMFRQTNDNVYTKSNATEFGFGVSGFLDFAIPSNPGAIRIRAGAARLTVRPNAATKSSYTGAQLENSETVFTTSAMFRISAPQDMVGGFGIFWGGIGMQMLYVMSTGRFDSSGTHTSGSKLANSYGYSPFLSLGAEIPFTTTEDFTFQLDWLPWRGFNAVAGIKTAL